VTTTFMLRGGPKSPKFRISQSSCLKFIKLLNSNVFNPKCPRSHKGVNHPLSWLSFPLVCDMSCFIVSCSFFNFLVVSFFTYYLLLL
jgi:hypothetical protein